MLALLKEILFVLPSSKMIIENFLPKRLRESEPLQECPLGPFEISRRCATDFASISRTDSVSSQPMHASVILTPYFRPDLPSLGTFWFPADN